MSAKFVRQTKLPTWRKIAVHAWRTAADPTVYGTLDLRMTAALKYIEDTRAKTGVKITMTHLVGKAIALAISERPEVNAIIRRGREIYLRDSIDVFFQVAMDGGEDLSGAKIARADQKSVADIARELQERAERVRARRDADLRRTESMLDRVPGALRGPLLKTVEFLTYDLGLDLRKYGLPFDQFGSVMVTNVGMFGLPVGLAPLVPFSRVPVLLTIGAIEDRPAVEAGKVRVAPMVTVGATFDHRLLDGYQAGRLARRFREVMENPAEQLKD